MTAVLVASLTALLDGEQSPGERRRGSFRYEQRIDAPADDVWELVGDPARLCEWFPGIVSSAVDGDERVVTRRHRPADTERLLTVDPLLRRFQYRIDARCSRAASDHRCLRPRDGTSRRLSTDADPAPVRLLIGAEQPAPSTSSHHHGIEELMGRKILFVTTDQQRYDTLGCNGGRCREPRRSTRWHGRASATSEPAPNRCVHAVGARPSSRPTPEHARRLDERGAAPPRCTVGGSGPRDAGYRTAIVGKAHFEPFLDVFGRFEENTLAAHGTEPRAAPSGLRAPRVRHPRAMGPLHYAR